MKMKIVAQGAYRFGFNGKENDNEVKGVGISLDYGARIYDPRLGRWLACDPQSGKYAAFSPYNFVANNPIMAVDPDGEKIEIVVRRGFLGIGRIKVQVEYDQKTNTVSIKEKLHGKQEKFANDVLTSLQNDLDKHSGHEPDAKNERKSKLVDVLSDERLTTIVKARNTFYTRDKIYFDPDQGGLVGKTGIDGKLKIKGSESLADILGGEIRHNWNDWYDNGNGGYDDRLKQKDLNWGNREERKTHTEWDKKILGVDRQDHNAELKENLPSVLDKPEMKKEGTTLDKKEK